jgi:hypothetical protein
MPKKKSKPVHDPVEAPPRFQFPAKGFKHHDGGNCPVDPEQYVETIIRTAEGYGSGGVTKALVHFWNYEAHDEEAGLGEVVGYRLAKRGEEALIDPMERF